MAEGTKSFKGLALPLNGEYEQRQITAADDMATLTGATSQTGDFIVCQNSSGTEKFVVDVNGDGQINTHDLVDLTADWLATCPDPTDPCLCRDVNGDGTIDMDDLEDLTDQWLADCL